MDQDKAKQPTDDLAPEKDADATELAKQDLDNVVGGTARGGSGGGTRPIGGPGGGG